LCGSEATFSEFGSVILRKKFDRCQDPATRRAFAALIRRHTKVFEVSELDVAHLPRACRDFRDDKFLALALACNADFIVSSDADLLSMNPYEGIAVVNAMGFLAAGEQPARKGK
jgi:putative PIN family toxin of toxin-antitoxin system